MRFDFQGTTVEIQARALVVAGGIVVGLVLLVVLANSGPENAIDVARDADSPGGTRTNTVSQEAVAAPGTPSAVAALPAESWNSRTRTTEQTAPSQSPEKKPEAGASHDGAGDASASRAIATTAPSRPRHLALPLAAAAEKAGYEPPSKSELAQMRREIRGELQRIAGTQIVLRDDVPRGEAADPFYCLKQYEAAGQDQRKVAYVLGTQLELARQLLSAEETEVRRSGLGIAHFAADTAAGRLKRPQIGRDVCLAYLLPNVDAAEKRHWKVFSDEMILKEVVSIALRAEDYATMRTAATWLRGVAHNRNVADFARLRIAQSLRQQGDVAGAIATLEEIDDSAGTGMAGAKRYLPQLRAELAEDNGEGKTTSAR